MAKKKRKREIKKKRRTAKKTRSKKSLLRKNKPKKRRDLNPFSGLDKTLFSKIKQEYHDLDYIDQLSEKEKKWMSTFMEEYLGARVNHKSKKIHKKLDTKEGRKKVFDPNNARNRDIYSNMKAQGKLMYDDPNQYIEALQQEHYDAQDIENRLIDAIDEKKLIDD